VVLKKNEGSCVTNSKQRKAVVNKGLLLFHTNKDLLKKLEEDKKHKEDREEEVY